MTGKDVAVDQRSRTRADRADLEAFVIAHYPRLIRLAGMVTHDVETAQDAVQSALERAWRHRRELADPARLRQWLDRIVVREAIRQSSRRRSWLDRLFGPARVHWIDMEDGGGAVPDISSDVTNVAALQAAYAGLSEGHRAVVALHLYAGYSIDETARSLDVPVDTVRSRLRAARRRLREELSEVTS